MKIVSLNILEGAGVSVEAGIPDFRSSSGLFDKVKNEYPHVGFTTGKDIFEVSVFDASKDLY
jgi:NAD+-dependent protein deacetylase SIR2